MSYCMKIPLKIIINSFFFFFLTGCPLDLKNNSSFDFFFKPFGSKFNSFVNWPFTIT